MIRSVQSLTRLKTDHVDILLCPHGASRHQKAYTFGLANPNLTAVISNMVNEQQMRENLAVVSA